MPGDGPTDRPLQHCPDAVLVTRCAAGDREASHELTVRYYRPVCGFLLKRVQQPDLVEDLAQETFLEALQALKNGARPVQFAAWLFGVAANRCGKWFRRKRPRLFAPDDPPVTLAEPSFVAAREELEEQQRLLAALEKSLAALPAEARTLLEMKHRQGKTCEEIARELGRPVGTVKSLLARAYKNLRTRMGVSGEEQP
jgi:RNA polymerase sigma-70 factor (ECF subfamily)